MSDTLMLDCERCGTRIEVDQPNQDTIIQCPTCKHRILVPRGTPLDAPPAWPPAIERKLEYKVVPFVASIKSGDKSAAGAAQLEELIRSHATSGWEYVRLESVETYVAGDSGCFGIGATPPRLTSSSMVVFRK